MKPKIFLIVLLFLAASASAQIISGKSAKKKIDFSSGQRSVVTQLPDLIIKGEKFVDENENNLIDGNENCFINLIVENIGEGNAEAVNIKVSTKNDNIAGLNYTHTITLGDIQANSGKNVSIPINGGMDLENGMAEFLIEVIENRGFDAFPLEIKVETRPYATPKIIVADAEFSTEDGGLIKLNYPINLKVIIQNIGQGDAKNVITEFKLPNLNCVFLGEENRFELGSLSRGETVELEFFIYRNQKIYG